MHTRSEYLHNEGGEESGVFVGDDTCVGTHQGMHTAYAYAHYAKGKGAEHHMHIRGEQGREIKAHRKEKAQ